MARKHTVPICRESPLSEYLLGVLQSSLKILEL